MMSDTSAPPKRALPMRFMLYLVLLVGAGSAGIYTIDELVVGPQMARERQLKAELAKERKQREALELRAKELETFVTRLKHTERRAQIVVLDQQKTADGQTTTKIRFTEIDADGNPVTQSRDLDVSGDEVYFDCLVASFDDDFVEKGHALKGEAVLIFRRIFTDKQRPLDGYVLDREGVAPELYAAQNAASPLEKEIWSRFWELANDSKEAKKQGLRSLHGKALYTRLVKNKVYLIEMRSTGEMFIGPPGALKN